MVTGKGERAGIVAIVTGGGGFVLRSQKSSSTSFLSSAQDE